MNTREPLYPEHKISKTLDNFRQPPGQPPQGREVMERFFQVFYSVPKNERNKNDAALTVAKELCALWELGDARIPVIGRDKLKKKILGMRQDLTDICNESKKGTPAYVVAVSY